MLSISLFSALISYTTLFVNTVYASPLQNSSANLQENVHNHVTHQDFSIAAPFPILDIGLQHILAQIGANATEAGNDSMSGTSDHRIATSGLIATQEKDVVDQCGPGAPCADGSCCNSEGKCGYTDYNCRSTASTRCLSNCDARAMCGRNSRDGAQKCPLNLCCSYFGYCGTSEVHCSDPNGMAPCQQEFGSCNAPAVPSCNPDNNSASRGRRVAYYQAGNIMYRKCNRISPSDIIPYDLTHLIFAFASINPATFEIKEAMPGDRALYYEFTALRSPYTQTWIGLGGYGFSDPGDTFTTWSELCADPARRAKFIASLINFLAAWGLQGVDIDWEYPVEANRGGRPIDTANLNTLVGEMRAAFGTRFGISIALPADYSYLEHFDVATLSQFVDFFNFMSYDLHGPWEAGILGPYLRAPSSIIDIANDLLPLWFANVPPSKVNIGVSMYGRSYTLQNPDCAELGCAYTGVGIPGVCSDSAGVLSLEEITLLRSQKGLNTKILPDVMMEQISYDNQYIIFDGSATVDMKLKWADGLCLGGLVIWGVDFYSGWGSGFTTITDSRDGTCGSTKSTTCMNLPQNQRCCSKNGFCGSTTAHCETANGCQPAYGLCTADPVALSPDGKCGPDTMTACYHGSFGDCCSKNGWCGGTAEYCGYANGCQSGYGLCY